MRRSVSYSPLVIEFLFHSIDIDECASIPCQNNATCADAVDMYTCKCVAGFTGIICVTSKQHKGSK